MVRDIHKTLSVRLCGLQQKHLPGDDEAAACSYLRYFQASQQAYPGTQAYFWDLAETESVNYFKVTFQAKKSFINVFPFFMSNINFFDFLALKTMSPGTSVSLSSFFFLFTFCGHNQSIQMSTTQTYSAYM